MRKPVFKNKSLIRKGNQGFSLLEVLVAIVILALVAAPVLQSFVASANINKNSDELLAATDVAQIVMEDLTSQSYINKISQTYATPNATPTLIVPGLGYTAPIASDLAVSDTSMNSFLGTVSAAHKTDSNQVVYFSKKLDNVECLGVSLHAVKYENYTFDVVYVLTPTSGVTASSKFFSYNIELRVYGLNGVRHYEKQLVTIYGAVANQK